MINWHACCASAGSGQAEPALRNTPGGFIKKAGQWLLYRLNDCEVRGIGRDTSRYIDNVDYCTYCKFSSSSPTWMHGPRGYYPQMTGPAVRNPRSSQAIRLDCPTQPSSSLACCLPLRGPMPSGRTLHTPPLLPSVHKLFKRNIFSIIRFTGALAQNGNRNEFRPWTDDGTCERLRWRPDNYVASRWTAYDDIRQTGLPNTKAMWKVRLDSCRHFHHIRHLPSHPLNWIFLSCVQSLLELGLCYTRHQDSTVAERNWWLCHGWSGSRNTGSRAWGAWGMSRISTESIQQCTLVHVHCIFLLISTGCVTLALHEQPRSPGHSNCSTRGFVPGS